MKYKSHDKVWAVLYTDGNNDSQVYHEEIPDGMDTIDDMAVGELEVRATGPHGYLLYDSATDESICLYEENEGFLFDTKEEADEYLAHVNEQMEDALAIKAKCRERAEIYHLVVDGIKEGIKKGRGAALTASIVLTELHRNGYEITKKEN